MKRKASSFLNTAFNAGSLAIDAMRRYKRRKGSKTSTSTPGQRLKVRTAYRYKAGFTTTQQDVQSKRTKKYNKTKVRKQQAFANKIQKALAPRQELNVYSETFNPRFNTGPLNPARIQLVEELDLQMNMGKLWSLAQNTGYIMGRYQNLIGSTNALVIPGAKSIIPNNEFKLQITSSIMDLVITNPSQNVQPTIYDVYEFVAVRDIADVNYSTPGIAWNRCLTENYSPTDATSRRPVAGDNGQTPYDCPQLGRWWKVLKKTRLYLSPNNSAQHMVNCGKFTLHGDKYQNNYAIAGISKAVIVIAGVGDNSDWTAGDDVVRTLPQKTWHFKYQLGEAELPQRPTNLMRVV